MKPSVAAALTGLLLALLPWLPSCPARIAAADLPPSPPRNANFSADGAALDSPSVALPVGGASSNAVLTGGADKPEASRSILPINEPSDSASNCSEGSNNCMHSVPADHPVDTASNATHPVVVDIGVAPAPDERILKDTPLPAGVEVASNHAQEVGNESPPGLNDIRETSTVPHAAPSDSNSTSTAPPSGVSGPAPASSSPSASTGRSFGSSIVGNHVFSTAPEGLASYQGTTDKMAAAVDPGVDLDDGQETLMPATTLKETPTPAFTSTPETTEKFGKDQKMMKQKGKRRQNEQEEREEDNVHEDADDDMEEGEEEREDESWDVHDERTTTRGDSPMDTTSLFYRHFSRMESQDFEEPGTTRQYVTVEKSSKLDYSSSHVVSEVYDSESPLEEDSTRGPYHAQEGSDTKRNDSPTTSSPMDAHDGHSVDEDTSDSPDYMEEDKLEENADLEAGYSTTTAPDLKVSKDQDSASSVQGGEAIEKAQTLRESGHTRPPPIPTSTEREAETALPTGLLETTRNRNVVNEESSEANSESSQASTPSPITTTSASNVEPLRESSHNIGLVTVHSVTSTTSSYSARTSRRLNLSRPSTTESPVKNEVTYNETVTGPTYDFKANISHTTPMVHLMLSAAPSTSTESSYAEKGGQSQSASPATLQTTDQTLPEVIPPSTTVTTPTTEMSHTTKEQDDGDESQGGGNSINDWTTIGRSGSEASSQKPESEIPPTTFPQTQVHENTTSNPTGSIVMSSVLYTTVQNSSASDLVSESMSVSSTSEEVTPSPVISSTVAASSESVSERVTVDVAELIGSGDEISSVSPMSSTSESAKSPDSVVPSAATYSMSTGVTPGVEISSSTSSDLLPYKVKTKVSPEDLADKEGTTRLDSSVNEVKSNESVSVLPMTTMIHENSTSPAEATSSTPIASKDPSRKTTFIPVVVKLNSSSTAGMTDTAYKTSIPSAGTDEENEESVITYPWHVRLVMKISWSEICQSNQQSSLKQALAQLISSALISNSAHSILPMDRVLLLNVDESCPNASGSPSEVHFCILSSVEESSVERERAVGEMENVKHGATVVHCDPTLMQLFLNIWDKAPKPMVEPLTHVKEVGIAHSGSNVDVPVNPEDDNTGVQAAIGISCVAALALFLLAALLIVMRRRQRRFNYGQRCTPVSLDAYSLDSVSVREGNRSSRGRARNGDAGGRRGVNGLSKGDGLNDWRASKRSYGNPAFEDDDGEEVLLSKPMNLATLTNAALDDDGALADEFRLIPKRFRKRTVRRKSRSKNKDPAGVAERGEAVGGTSSRDEDDDERLPEGAEEKNRYANVVPLPSTRVRLSAKPSGPLSTYINANFVRGPKNEERFYIACQAPLQSTIEDFWRMIWEQQSKVILMLTNLVENSIEKCADYLPPSEVLDCHRLFGDFQVTLKKREVREKYIVSSLQLKNMDTNLWREVTHLWFLGWPDQGVPEEPNPVISFLIEARSFIKANPGPTVVHCSPGTGRTGTVIAIDICIRDFEQSRMIDVPKVVQQLRRDREGSVQTQQQYAFIYKALSLYAAKLTGGAMDSF